MAITTRIEWADATINPLVGCSKISPACENCYAERMAARMAHNPAVAHRYADTVDAHGKWTGKINLFSSEMYKVLRWRKAQRIFVGSMSDLFHPSVPDEHLDQVFAYMLASYAIPACAKHTFMLLTKRPDRMRKYLSAASSALIERWAEAGSRMIVWDNEEAIFSKLIESIANCGPPLFPLPNVWLGTTVEDQARADERVPELLATPGALHFVSCEPLLGPVDFSNMDVDAAGHDEWCTINALSGEHTDMGRPCQPVPRLGWIIAGGETGPGARPAQPRPANMHFPKESHHA